MSNNDDVLHALQRMNKLLALVVVKGLEDKDAVLTLLRAGYSQVEVASLLGKKTSAVGMIVLRNKPKKGSAESAAPTPTATNDDGE